MLSYILIALAVSVDGFGAGFSYGLRRLIIPIYSLIIICIFSSLAVLVSMILGKYFSVLLSPELASYIGGSILVLVGILILKPSIIKPSKKQKRRKKKMGSTIVSLIRSPENADIDKSGTICYSEAAILGLALAMDAFAAGFGAAMMGFSPFITALLVGISKFLLIGIGLYIGQSWSGFFSPEKGSMLAGFLLIFLGISTLM